MKWFIGFIAGLITPFLRFIVRKLGYATALFMVQKGVQILILATIAGAFAWFVGYLLQIWNMVSDIVSDVSSFSPGSGEAYGVSLSTLWESLKGFIYASGLSTAFVTCGNLLISVLSLIFIKALYGIYLKLIKYIWDMFSSGMQLLSNTIRL